MGGWSLVHKGDCWFCSMAWLKITTGLVFSSTYGRFPFLNTPVLLNLQKEVWSPAGKTPPFSLGNCWLAIWGEWKQNLEAARPYPADPRSLSGKEQTSSGPFLRIPVHLCCDDHKQNFRHWPGWAKLLPSPESSCTLDLAVDQNHHKLFYLRYTFKVSYNWIVNERWLPRSKRGLQTIAPDPDWGCCLFS